VPSSYEIIVRHWLNANQIVLPAYQGTVSIDGGYGRDKAFKLRTAVEALSGGWLDQLMMVQFHCDHTGRHAGV
jgi:hypothetical protein